MGPASCARVLHQGQVTTRASPFQHDTLPQLPQRTIAASAQWGQPGYDGPNWIVPLISERSYPSRRAALSFKGNAQVADQRTSPDRSNRIPNRSAVWLQRAHTITILRGPVRLALCPSGPSTF
jgi:hypothetical protein